MSLYCDNYARCNSVLIRVGQDEAVVKALARAKGWHIFEGSSMTGKQLYAVLCKRCVDGRRRDLPPAPEYLSGQLELELTNEGSTDPLS